MNLNDLFINKGYDPKNIIILRHRPYEPELKKVLPWLAAEKPNVFNAYQQTQTVKLEKAMEKLSGAGFVASFIGTEASKALFIGMYSIGNTKPLTRDQYWQVPEYIEMKAFGIEGFTENSPRKSVLWFDLILTDFYADWKGRLIVGWPPPERSWWRRAHRNTMPVLSILEESALDARMPKWNSVTFSWEELSVLPKRWKSVLAEWRGIYYIFDSSDGKGYVGSAYGETNIYGRWLNYAARGHGGNKLLKQRDPRNFRFSILQRVSPDMSPGDLIRLESSWKERLHTRQPNGLNDN
jgi:hypothetical protein